jgi:hypothetical protein
MKRYFYKGYERVMQGSVDINRLVHPIYGDTGKIDKTIIYKIKNTNNNILSMIDEQGTNVCSYSYWQEKDNKDMNKKCFIVGCYSLVYVDPPIKILLREL